MFTHLDGETVVWMIISVVIIAGGALTALYWERFLHKSYRREEKRRSHHD